jgi:hypothetical protein
MPGRSPAALLAQRLLDAGALPDEETDCEDTRVRRWDGSSWQPLLSESMCPGCTAWITGGNTGAPVHGEGNWYFKSEVDDNGTGDNATVDMADHVYSPGGKTITKCQSDLCVVGGGPCYLYCESTGCPVPNCAITFTGWECPSCSDDSCANPP